MDHSPQNLSPDSEWVLLSGQVSAEDLAAVLIEEYALQLYCLWYTLTGDISKSWEGLRATLSQALLKASQYNGLSSGRAWLYQLTLEVWRTRPGFKATLPDRFPWQDLSVATPDEERVGRLVQSSLSELNQQDQLLILFVLWQGCSTEEAADILNLESIQVEQTLRWYKASLLEKLPAEEFGSSGKLILDWFAAQAEKWREAHAFTSQETKRLFARVLETSRPKLIQKHLFVRLAEGLLVGLVILGIWGLFTSLDRFLPEPEPTQEIVYVTVFVTSTPPSGVLGENPPASQPVRPTGWPIPAAEVRDYIVQAGDDLETIARKFAGREADEILRFNRLAPGQDLEGGQRLLIPPRPDESPYPQATPVPGSGFSSSSLVEAPPRSPGAPRLFSQYRWNTEGWDTLWVDLVYRDHRQYPQHATAGRVRLQAWLSDNQLLAIQGTPEGVPDQVLLAWLGQDLYYQATPDEFDSRYRPLEADQFAAHPILRSYLTRLFNPFYPALRRGERSFRLSGVELMNGVEVEVLEGRNREGWLISRLWVDRDGGLILRSQRFSGDSDERLEDEIRVTRWAYNIDFPQDLFDPRFPWRGGFAQEYDGEPEISTLSKPVVAVPFVGTPVANPWASNLPSDAAFQPLTLRLTGSFSASSRTYQPLDIYAGETYLGRIRLNNLDKLVCERSPDGKILAFVNHPGSRHKPLTYLQWLSLGNGEKAAQQALSGIGIQYFAFASDSRRVAFFGEDGWRQGLFVYDLIDNRLDFLLQLDSAHSLAWRPDGKYILLIGSRGGQTGSEQVILVRASDGQEFFTQPDELVNGDLFNWPELEWGVNFPVEMKGLESCTS